MTSSRVLSRSLAAALALSALGVSPRAAEAFSPFLTVPDPKVAEASPAYRYANMSDAEAFAELDRRQILYQKLDPVPGVRAPIRLTGRLHGVYVHSSLPPDERVRSMFEILDARLGLALDDFCAVLERHEIDEVVHFTMYRPNVPAAIDHGPHDHDHEATSSKPAGARPRPEVSASASGKGKPIAVKGAPPGSKANVEVGKGAPVQKGPPSLGKGSLDASKAAAPQKAAMKQKDEDGGAGKAAIALPPKSAKKGEASAPKKGDASAPKKAEAGTKKAETAAPRAGAPSVKQVAKRDAAATGLHQTTWAAPGTRHPAGLAIDVGLLHKRDGRWLNVARDFHGRIGARTCGEGAPVPELADARELRALVCESSDLGVFTYVLTPDYNAAHADHFHMEIKPGVKWFLYH